jgi:hypothetical protein
MSRKYVVTARGVKLDLNALKAAHPNVKPVRPQKKDGNATVSSKTQKVSVKAYTPKIKATIPAPRPTFIPPAPVVKKQSVKIDVKEHKAEEPKTVQPLKPKVKEVNGENHHDNL